jgi:hypothetical protein
VMSLLWTIPLLFFFIVLGYLYLVLYLWIYFINIDFRTSLRATRLIQRTLKLTRTWDYRKNKPFNFKFLLWILISYNISEFFFIYIYYFLNKILIIIFLFFRWMRLDLFEIFNLSLVESKSVGHYFIHSW